MHRRLFILAALTALAPAASAHAAYPGVTGSAKNHLADLPPYPLQLEVAAHVFSSDLPTLDTLVGTDAVRGHVVGSGMFPNGAFRVRGPVTCLLVEGNRATIKYRITESEGPGAPPPGWGVQVFIEDNGEPGQGVPDANATDLPLPPALFDPQADICEPPRGPYNPVDSGNYVVQQG
jgi:hypothetical protein